MRVWILGVGSLLLGCGACGNSSEAPPAARSVAGGPAVGSREPVDAGVGARSDEADALWRLAGAGDPLDLARLADREGALALLDAVVAVGPRAQTALWALPHADDAELALAGLCSSLPKRKGAELHALLLSIHGIVSRPIAPRERFDPAGRASCGPLLTRVEKRKGLALAARDLASSARRYVTRAE